MPRVTKPIRGIDGIQIHVHLNQRLCSFFHKSKRHRARQSLVPGGCYLPYVHRSTNWDREKRAEGTHRVWMARREVNVPLARLWILLSYRERSERFCRSWKASGRIQLILLAFKSLWAEPGPGGQGRGTALDPSTRPGTFLGHPALCVSTPHRGVETSNCLLCAPGPF